MALVSLTLSIIALRDTTFLHTVCCARLQQDCTRMQCMIITALLLASAAAFSPKDAAAPLFAAQQAALAKIQAALPLDAKTYPGDLGLDKFTTSNGGAGEMQSWEAPGPANIAWVSDLRIEGPTTVASLTVWCAPLKDVPHLCVRTTATEEGVDVLMDFRPRAAVGYETMLEDGSYPEPDSREAFMNKGNRADLDKRYYDGVRDLCASVGGDAAPAGSLEDLKKQAASPVAVDARLPADDASLAKAAALYEPAVDAFLGWCADDQHELKPGMQVTSTYARDTKVRANNYGILADYYGELFGKDEGANIAAGDAGPLDEAYVGGAS